MTTDCDYQQEALIVARFAWAAAVPRGAVHTSHGVGLFASDWGDPRADGEIKLLLNVLRGRGIKKLAFEVHEAADENRGAWCLLIAEPPGEPEPDFETDIPDHVISQLVDRCLELDAVERGMRPRALCAEGMHQLVWLCWRASCIKDSGEPLTAEGLAEALFTLEMGFAQERIEAVGPTF